MIAMLREEVNSQVVVNHIEVGVQEEPIATGMEVDDEAMANVVNTATYDVSVESPQQVRCGRPPVYLPSLGPFSQPCVDSQGTKDSLLFPPLQSTLKIPNL